MTLESDYDTAYIHPHVYRTARTVRTATAVVAVRAESRAGVVLLELYRHVCTAQLADGQVRLGPTERRHRSAADGAADDGNTACRRAFAVADAVHAGGHGICVGM